MDLVLALLEADAGTSGAMGSTAITRPWPGKAVGLVQVDGLSSRAKAKAKTLGGSPDDQSGKPPWFAGGARALPCGFHSVPTRPSIMALASTEMSIG